MLQRHKAGDSLFVDWAGQTLKIVDPETGEISEAYAILKDLKQVALVRALERSDQPIAHENENSDLP